MRPITRTIADASLLFISIVALIFSLLMVFFVPVPIGGDHAVTVAKLGWGLTGFCVFVLSLLLRGQIRKNGSK